MGYFEAVTQPKRNKKIAVFNINTKENWNTDSRSAIKNKNDYFQIGRAAGKRRAHDRAVRKQPRDSGERRVRKNPSVVGN